MSFVTPPTFAVGDVFTSTAANIYAGDLNAIWGGAWTPYTPAWAAASGGTNPTLGNGTLSGFYKVIGKLCAVHFYLQFGSTTNGGLGAWTFTLPVNPALNVEQSLLCRAQPNGTVGAPGTMLGVMIIGAGSTITVPYLPQSITSTILYAAQNTNNSGTAGSGIPAPTGGSSYPFLAGANLVATGTYETA